MNLNSVIPSELSVGISSAYEKDPRLVEAILSESKRIVRMEHGVIIVETNHNFICANAGIDESNVEKGFATLLPIDPDKSAKKNQRRNTSDNRKKYSSDNLRYIWSPI